MATNKTSFLGLNDFVGTDPFRREEINVNFRSLDAKMKEHDDSIGSLSKAASEYEWTSAAGQVTYVMPAGQTYDTTTKWFEVTVGGAPVPLSQIQMDSPSQFTLLVDSASIPDGVTVVARWVEPFVPATAGHHTKHELGGADEIDITLLKNFNEQVVAPLADITTNVKSLGAKGNGSTDDTVSIQNALNTYNRVLIAGGTFLIDPVAGLNLKSGQTLYISKDAVLQAKGVSSPNYSLINIIDKQNVTIYCDGKIIGDKDNHVGSTGEWGMGITINGSTDVNIYTPDISKCWGDGIYIGSTTNQTYCENVLIYRPKVDNCRRQGISLVSGKNVKIINPTLTNIVGTAPQAGIDVEPNDGTNFLEGIVIDNPYTKGNAGAGINVELVAMRDSGKFVDVTINNHYDDGSLTGFSMYGHWGVLKGKVIVDKPRYKNSKTNGILVRNYSLSAPFLKILNPTILNPNVNASASTTYGAGILIYREAADTGDSVLGNVYLEKPTIRDTRQTPLTKTGIKAADLNTGNYLQKIYIIDPSFDGVSNELDIQMAGTVTDGFSMLEKTADLNLTQSTFDYYRTYHNGSATANRNVILSKFKAGFPIVTFEVRNAGGFTYNIIPDATDNILPIAPTAGKYITATTQGSKITLKKATDNSWYVVEMIGTWTVQP